MDKENVTAQELCEIANQYEVTSAEIVKRVASEASNAARRGRKQAEVPFNSKVTSDSEYEDAKAQLEQRGFTLSADRSGEWLRIKVTFDVCD
tara:strand:- start:98 stop:373 length:276 start_codon:yes stop_codon:yes gene_type:complete